MKHRTVILTTIGLLLLAFSGSFLMGMTVFTLIPEVYYTIFEENHQTLSISISLLDVDTHIFGKKIGFWVIIGILLQIILEFFSHGAEHGHFHSPAKKLKMQFPWGLFISLSIHSILEGFPLHNHSNMVYGIFIHHLPIAMVLTIFFLESEIGVKKILIFLSLFSLMTICRQLKVNCRQQSKDKCLQKRNRKLIGENRNWTNYWIVEQKLCRIE